jgi:hypothetical protein
MLIQIVDATECINVARVPDGAAISTDGKTAEWTEGSYPAPDGCTLMNQAGAGIGFRLVGGVLMAPVIVAPAPTPAQLLAYAEALRAKISAGGISVNIAASGATPQMVEIGTDTAGLAFLANAVQLTATAPGTSYDWDQAAPVTLNGAQVLAIQAAVGLFNQALFTQKTALRAAIAAGTITTFAQIDDPTSIGLPSWPVNS